MIRPLALFVVAFTIAYQVHAQRQHTFLTGISSAGYQLGYQKQFTPKFAYSFQANYLYAKPTLFTQMSGEEIRIKGYLNNPQGSFSVKYIPWGKFETENFQRRGIYFLAGIAYRLNSTYQTVFSFRQPLVLGEFNLTEEQSGKVQVDVQSNRLQPFAAIGFEITKPGSRLGLVAEAGAYYHGNLRSEMTATGTLQLNERNEAQIQKNLSRFTFYPLVNISLAYKLKTIQ